MSKRESGWYRVKEIKDDEWMLLEYLSKSDKWKLRMIDDKYWYDDELFEIDPQMVMTPSGEMVYNQPVHDPLYNTKQEG